MRRRVTTNVFMAFSFFAIFYALSGSAGAQAGSGQVSVAGFGKSSAKPLPPGGPAPRTADGHPDLSGVWFPGKMGREDLTAEASPEHLQFDPKVTPEEKPPYQPWAAERVKKLSTVDAEILRPSVNCMPRGVPGMFITNPYPIELVLTKTELIQLNELNNNFRIIPTDGRPHSKDPDPTFNGEGVAHWDGDTLVIDTIAIDERTWNNFVGWFHSDEEHIVERISRPSLNYLTYQVTIEDPKVLTKPWTSAPRTWSLGREALQEYYCTNNREEEALKALRDLTEGPKK